MSIDEVYEKNHGICSFYLIKEELKHNQDVCINFCKRENINFDTYELIHSNQLRLNELLVQNNALIRKYITHQKKLRQKP